MKKSLLIFSSLIFVVSGLFSENISSQKNYFQVGLSSWYGDNFQGRLTANGERFDKSKLTAAHRELPLGSIIKVKNLENQKEILVTINDRGPFAEERIMDVTEKAAEELDFRDTGIAKIGISLTKSLTKDNEPDEGFDEFLDSDVDSEDEEIINDSKSTEDSSKKVPPTKKEEAKKETPKKETKSESKDSKNESKETKNESKETKNESKNSSKDSKGKTKGNQPKGFTVQLGVFKSEEAISKFKDLEKIFNEKVFTFTRDGAYVVQIGDFSTRKSALEFQKKVRAKGFSTFVPLNK